MKHFNSVFHTQIIECAALGLVVELLLFSGKALANDPTSSQVSYFNAYKYVYGNSWNMVWNKDNSIPLAVYGGHFKP
ncbi:MAG: hypothetical protein M1381_09340 [Deltaproteobacteria bacterium]|nr:hypothetical protein [Deltaproteobacteria bacterium]MCL5792764.1 hypothetical protein [Deltaproteobacteria bacterium]